MANYLLDTHAAVWFFEESDELSDFRHKAIRHYQNDIYLSIALLWKIAVKISTGKLNLNVSIKEFAIFLLIAIFRFNRSR